VAVHLVALLTVYMAVLGVIKLLVVQVLVPHHVVMVSLIVVKHAMKEVLMVQELDVPHLAQLIADMNAHGVDHLLQVLVLVLNHAEMASMIMEKNVMRAVLTAPLMPVHQHVQKILVILVYGLDIHLVAQAHAQSYLLIVVMESLILEKYAMMVTMMILMVAQMVAIK